MSKNWMPGNDTRGCRQMLWRLCTTCCILLMGETAYAQSRGSVLGVWPTSRLSTQIPKSSSQVGIGSATVSAWGSAASEARIFRYLLSQDDTKWKSLRIRDLVGLLNQTVPTYLNVAELDMLGVDPDYRIEDTIPPSSLGDRLLKVLDALELTIDIEGNMLVITSMDDVDSNPMIRLYDIANIVHGGDQDGYDIDNLRHQIIMHIDPDRWLTNGGMSDVTFYFSNARAYLVVSAPLVTQLKVNALLNTLQAGEPRGRTIPSRLTAKSSTRAALAPVTENSNPLRSPYRDLPSSGRDRISGGRFKAW